MQKDKVQEKKDEKKVGWKNRRRRWREITLLSVLIPHFLTDFIYLFISFCSRTPYDGVRGEKSASGLYYIFHFVLFVHIYR